MTSICNYSHPDLQLHNGLTHQGHGTLFPYNPEFYESASGLYGPGSIYCWYLLIASFTINCAPLGLEKHRAAARRVRVRVSNDLVAIVAFALFAATDALVQALHMLGTPHRGLAIFCLRFPGTDLGGFGPFNRTQLDLGRIPPDVVDLGQRAININGPLDICYAFTFVALVLAVLFSLGLSYDLFEEPSVYLKLVAYGSYGYTVLCLTVIHLSLGDFGASFVIWMYRALDPVLRTFLLVSSATILLGVLGGLFTLGSSSVRKGDRKEFREAMGGIGGCVVLGAFVAFAWWQHTTVILWLPDLAVSVRERDQLAALLGGIVSLCATLKDFFLERQDSAENGSNAWEMMPISEPGRTSVEVEVNGRSTGQE